MRPEVFPSRKTEEAFSMKARIALSRSVEGPTRVRVERVKVGRSVMSAMRKLKRAQMGA